MAIIDPDGLFGGDRLRRCSNMAQLHWPRLYLASDGFGRLEINYAKIIGRAYSTFTPVPSEAELQVIILEFATNHLLFLYKNDGQLWGQWDTRSDLLPKYKKAADRRSPAPPEPAFSEWKLAYRIGNKASTFLGNLPETFPHGIGNGIGIGKTIYASRRGDAHVGGLPSIDEPPFDSVELADRFKLPSPKRARLGASDLTAEQEGWFNLWWDLYWLHRAKKAARKAFGEHVRTAERFQLVMKATESQRPEMLAREPCKRPHGATWLNGERWDDQDEASCIAGPDDYPEFQA